MKLSENISPTISTKPGWRNSTGDNTLSRILPARPRSNPAKSERNSPTGALRDMIRFLLSLALSAALWASPDDAATPPRSSHCRAVHARSERRCESCARTPSGRIRRSTTVRRQFQRDNPCPETGLPTGACPGTKSITSFRLRAAAQTKSATCNGSQ
jgi:hypothetical protein